MPIFVQLVLMALLCVAASLFGMGLARLTR